MDYLAEKQQSTNEEYDPTTLSTRFPSDALRLRCHELLDGEVTNLPEAMKAVYAYSVGIKKDMPKFAGDCFDPDCQMCSLVIANELSIAKQKIKLFLTDLYKVSLDLLHHGTAQEHADARHCYMWIRFSLEVPEKYRFLDLPEP